MKKLLLISGIFVAFFACKKEDKLRQTSSYGQAIDSMNLSYEKTYIFHFNRNTPGGMVHDSDRILFHTNGTVTEVSNRFDSSSYTFPDSLVYAVNTSFDYNISWNNIPNALLFNFYPLHDSVRGFLLHDYLNTCAVSVFTSRGSTGPNQIKVTPTLADSTVTVTGYIK
ncbi:MAG: hypothetical protein H7257_08610 [Taibaiella sp.]|nr:hypothetical protein [Taibaiella sp.]